MTTERTEYERVTALLDEVQARPCAWCEAEPRLKGDHLGARCRAEFEAKFKIDDAQAYEEK